MYNTLEVLAQEISPSGNVSVTEGSKLVFNYTGNGTRQQNIIPQFNSQSVDPALITTDPTDCTSQHVSHEEIEMKQIDMLCNPAYAVPSEVIENKGYQGNKMANTEHITYEIFVN